MKKEKLLEEFYNALVKGKVSFVELVELYIFYLEKQKKVLIVGAMHNLRTGKVSFFDINGKAI